jgi:hypothetical protein
LGQLFKIALNLKQYASAKLTPRKRIIIAIRPNSVIASMVINPHMALIQVQVGKNIIEDILMGDLK